VRADGPRLTLLACRRLHVARRGTENRTALISLGIPKLVRFHKSAPRSVQEAHNGRRGLSNTNQSGATEDVQGQTRRARQSGRHCQSSPALSGCALQSTPIVRKSPVVFAVVLPATAAAQALRDVETAQAASAQ